MTDIKILKNFCVRLYLLQILYGYVYYSNERNSIIELVFLLSGNDLGGRVVWRAAAGAQKLAVRHHVRQPCRHITMYLVTIKARVPTLVLNLQLKLCTLRDVDVLLETYQNQLFSHSSCCRVRDFLA